MRARARGEEDDTACKTAPTTEIRMSLNFFLGSRNLTTMHLREENESMRHLCWNITFVYSLRIGPADILLVFEEEGADGLMRGPRPGKEFTSHDREDAGSLTHHFPRR